MVKKVMEPTEGYRCERCANTYLTMEKAVQCESNPISPFKYEIGDMVQFEFKSRLTPKHVRMTGIVERRWIHGLSEKGEPAHGNRYKLRTVGEGKGLIACRFESEILRRVGR